MKNLCNTIREMAERPVETDMKKAFHGTLTEMARQVVSGQAEQLDEVKKRNEWGMTQADAKKARKRTLARQAKAAKSYVPSEAAKKESDAVYRRVTGKPPVNEESDEEAMKRLAEDTLEEGILKKLRRAKGAAYKAMQRGEGDKHARLHGVASGLESRYRASMARRGGASPEAVKGAGSLLGKRGDYTLKAGKLSRQHDNAVRKFHNTAWEKHYGPGSEAVTTGYGMFNKNAATKRKNQQAQAEFANKARSGDFGQDNQAALRARSNFQKKYGRLKGK